MHLRKKLSSSWKGLAGLALVLAVFGLLDLPAMRIHSSFADNSKPPIKNATETKQEATTQQPSSLRKEVEPAPELDDFQQKLLNQAAEDAAHREAEAKGIRVNPLIPAPANDLCAAAELIPGAGPFPYVTSIVNITTAGDEAIPPAPTCPTATPISRSIWFSFTPTTTGSYRFSTSASGTSSTSFAPAPTLSSVNDTDVAVYSSSNNTCGGTLTQVGCSDDEGVSLQSEATATLTAGQTYFVVAWKFDAPAPVAPLSGIQLFVTRTVPVNDGCAGVQTLTLNTIVPGATFGGTNDYTTGTGAGVWNPGTASFGTGVENSTTSTAPGRDVIYQFTAPSAGDYSFSITNGQVLGSGLNLVTYLVNGPTCPTPGLVTILAGANRTTAHEQIACVPLTSGQTVFLIVDDNTGANEDGFFVQVTQCSKEPEFAPNVLNGTNDSTGTATTYADGITGQIGAAGDIDFYTIPNQAVGSRVFAIVNGAYSASTNFDLRITNSTDTLEFDDGNNVTMFGGSAPNIAGRPLTAASGQFFRVSQNSGSTASAPYQLFAVTRPMGSEVAETAAANDTIDDAGVQTGNYFAGSFSSTTDVDLYKFTAAAGDIIFVSFDGSPDRTSTTTLDAILTLLDPAGNQLVLVDDGGTSANTTTGAGSLTATTPNSTAETLLFMARTSGTYYARARLFGVPTGNYLLSIATFSTATPADLSITKTDGVTAVAQGGTLTYTIVGSNGGPGAANGATVTDTFPAQIASANWTASYAGGAAGPANGSGNINATLTTFPSGGSVTFTVTAMVGGAATGTISNTAMIATPGGVTDPTPGNNSATDTDTIMAAACMLTCPSNIVTNNSAGQCGAVVTFANPVTTGSCGTVTAVPPSGSFFSVGSTMVTFTSTAGPSCSFTVTVNDTEPPMVTCPANIVTGATSTAGAVVTFMPTVWDNCSVASIVSTPPSGSTFPIGTTTVMVTATDGSNNTASCSFTVTVQGVELDRVYVADTANNRCQVFDGAVWQLVPGTAGTVGSSSNQFRSPEAITANADGSRIYVADTGNNRIQFTTDSGATWQTFATLGSASNQVRAPQGLALDLSGNLYVADTGNNRLMRFDGGVPGAAVIFATAGSTLGKVSTPRGLAVDASRTLYVADFGNNRIQKFTTADVTPTPGLVATTGSSQNPGQVRSPEGVGVDDEGNLYVADTGNNRVLEFPAGAAGPALLFLNVGSSFGKTRLPEGVTVCQGVVLGGMATESALIVGDTANNRIQGSLTPADPLSYELVGNPLGGVGSLIGNFRSPSKIR